MATLAITIVLHITVVDTIVVMGIVGLVVGIAGLVVIGVTRAGSVMEVEDHPLEAPIEGPAHQVLVAQVQEQLQVSVFKDDIMVQTIL
jgi:hypothetical protein